MARKIGHATRAFLAHRPHPGCRGRQALESLEDQQEPKEPPIKQRRLPRPMFAHPIRVTLQSKAAGAAPPVTGLK